MSISLSLFQRLYVHTIKQKGFEMTVPVHINIHENIMRVWKSGTFRAISNFRLSQISTPCKQTGAFSHVMCREKKIEVGEGTERIRRLLAMWCNSEGRLSPISTLVASIYSLHLIVDITPGWLGSVAHCRPFEKLNHQPLSRHVRYNRVKSVSTMVSNIKQSIVGWNE